MILKKSVGDNPITVVARSLQDVQDELKRFLLDIIKFNASDASSYFSENASDVLKQIYLLIGSIKEDGIIINSIIQSVISHPNSQTEKLYDLFFGAMMRSFLSYVSTVCTILLSFEKIETELALMTCSKDIRNDCKTIIAKVAKRPEELLAAFDGILANSTLQVTINSNKDLTMIAKVTQRMRIFEDVVQSLLILNSNLDDSKKIDEFEIKYKHDNAKQVAIDLLIYVNQFGTHDSHIVDLQSYLYNEFLAVVNREAPYIEELEVFTESPRETEQAQLDSFRSQLTITSNMQNSLHNAQQVALIPAQSEMPHFQHNRDDIQAQLRLLMERQNQLAAFVLSRELRMHTMRDQYAERPNCLLFYRILNIRLEEYFQGLKLVASGLVSHHMADSKSLAEKGCELAEKIGHAIPLVGGTIALFFGISKEAMYISNQTSMMNCAKHISELATIGEFISSAEETAREMTELLAPHLDLLLTEAEAMRLTDTRSQRVGDGFFSVAFNSHAKAPAQWLAEYCAIKVLDGLLNEHTIRPERLTPQFVQLIVGEYKFKSVHAIQKLGFQGFISRGIYTWPHRDIREVQQCGFVEMLGKIGKPRMPALPASNNLMIVPGHYGSNEEVQAMREEITLLRNTVEAQKFQMQDIVQELRLLRAKVEQPSASFKNN
ncbi:MAG: hypothetical protein M3R00_00885 [Pseudomonadota bacterium]|nr:hypothetical protein [Pseudomonadota bacterium]